MVEHRFAVAVALCAGTHAIAQTDPYAPPASYYAEVSGTGAALEDSLRTAMTTGHIQRRYGDFRNSAVIHDADPNVPGNILLTYNRASVSGTWDSGSTWNREHVWPQSLQPGSASNSTRGNLGDPHALRPCNPGINSSRSNKPFGLSSTTGGFANLGVYYFTGDSDKGDIARQLFYSDVRWSSQGISLVNGTPGSNQMGDLASLITWHYLDTPDEFERRRNHAIYSQTLNPSYYTNNRNAFVDIPEAVWSIYVDQNNDSSLYVGGIPNADGSSTLTIDLGMFLVGQTVPDTFFTLNKAGLDGTYYSVEPSAEVLTTHDGRHNAFRILNSGGDTEVIDLGFVNTTASTPGTMQGTVTIDNLDMTTGFGVDSGANDGDDIITLSATIVENSNASFDPVLDENTLLVDLGSLTVGDPASTTQVTIYNLGGTFTAPVALGLGASSGDTSILTIPIISEPSVAASFSFDASLDTATEGLFSATYTIATADDASLTGATSGVPLTLTLIGEVTSAACITDVTTAGATLPGQPGYGVADGISDLDDLGYYLNFWLTGDPAADVTTAGASIPGQPGYGIPDGMVDLDDLGYFIGLWLVGCN
ncbi:MAG: GC-type dockerin domain-anchored protein [Planctomycetota bacterium]